MIRPGEPLAHAADGGQDGLVAGEDRELQVGDRPAAHDPERNLGADAGHREEEPEEAELVGRPEPVEGLEVLPDEVVGVELEALPRLRRGEHRRRREDPVPDAPDLEDEAVGGDGRDHARRRRRSSGAVGAARASGATGGRTDAPGGPGAPGGAVPLLEHPLLASERVADRALVGRLPGRPGRSRRPVEDAGVDPLARPVRGWRSRSRWRARRRHRPGGAASGSPRIAWTIRPTWPFSAAPYPVTAIFTSDGVASRTSSAWDAAASRTIAARVAHRERGLHVAGVEDALHAEQRRPVQLDEVLRGRAWIASSRSASGRSAPGVEDAEVDGPEAAPRPFDEAVAQRGGPRVDPEDDHPATSARISSVSSRLLVTRWTSSRSSRCSTRRRFWRAREASTAMVCFAIIAASADSIADAGAREGRLDRLEVARLGVDLEGVGGRLDVARPGIDGEERDLVGVGTRARHGDHAALLELPGDGPGPGQLAAGLGEDGANLGDRPVPIVGGHLDEDGDAAGAVALVDDLLVLDALAAAGCLLDGALDRVERHVGRTRLLDREPEPEVAVRIAAAGPGRERDLAPHLREDGAALDVVDALLALDLGPFGVTGHRGGV